MMKLKNRYNDEYTFTKTEDGNVLWEGPFRWTRISWPNDYNLAYVEYTKNGGDLSFEDFIEEIHKYDKETLEPSEICRKYNTYILSDMSKIHMVDPSGGPYIEEGMNLGRLLGDEFNNLIVHEFESVHEGYKIIIKKC